MLPIATDQELAADYQALEAGAGLVDFGDRTLLELTGDDRARFLHNLCTNEIRKLPAGAGCEAFLTNVQGKLLGHVLVFAADNALLLETVPGQAERILAHLDRYLIREQVVLRDRTSERFEWLLAGRQAAELLAKVSGTTPPTALLASQPATIAGRTVWLRHVELAGPRGFLVDCEREEAAAVGAELIAAGARGVGPAAFEVRRIESGFPFYGRDISEKNLPQEVDRDRRAISFTKGCYLGQETVARIDALGHVNRTLVGLRFEVPDVPPAGLALTAGGTAAGEVTSSCFAPHLGVSLALGYVRRGSNTPGTPLDSPFGAVAVIALPLVGE